MTIYYRYVCLAGVAAGLLSAAAAAQESAPTVPAQPAAAVSSAARDSQPLDCVLEPHIVVNVSSPVAGILDQVNVDRGDSVKKGQVLAKLRSGVEQASVDLAKAKVVFGRRQSVRSAELYKEKFISAHDKEEKEVQTRLAQLELRQAEEVLAQKTIKSPIDGVVVERNHSAGELVKEDQLFRLAQIDPLNVEVVVPVSLIGTVKPGMQAEVEPEAPVRGKYMARVKVVDRVVDAASGTFGVRLELPNPDHRIPAGLKCKLRFKAGD